MLDLIRSSIPHHHFHQIFTSSTRLFAASSSIYISFELSISIIKPIIKLFIISAKTRGAEDGKSY